MRSKNKVPEDQGNPRFSRAFGALPAVLAIALLGTACGQGDEPAQVSRFTAAGAQEVGFPVEQLEVPPPPFSPGIYPCSNCHGMLPVNPIRRELGFHADIVLTHDEENRWCLDCHESEDRDILHLASGEPVLFEESYRLCGQCHGEKYRDWRAGVHGRRSGNWDGPKTYLLCAHCHNPHSPRFQPLAPEPAPIPPDHTGGGLGR